MKKTSIYSGGVIGVAVALVAVANGVIAALAPANDFGLQVSPSPLVTTLKPGKSTDLDLKIRNTGNKDERLKIQPRAFVVDKKTGDVKLLDKAPAEVKDWVSFSAPSFNVAAGDVFSERIHIDLPKDAGFSYSFALLINKASADESAKSGESIKGSVAVFALINVDRPGAVRRFEVTSFKPTQPVFEYLPANFDITLTNTGNTIIQPAGNVFIQRGSDDSKAITTLPVNDGGGYLLPSSPRTLTTKWSEGFPVYKTVNEANGQEKQDLVWDWSKLTDFRFGEYTAKLVTSYNDGQRDIPVVSETTFWVIPWRALLVLLAVIIIIILLFRVLIRHRTHHAVKNASARKHDN